MEVQLPLKSFVLLAAVGLLIFIIVFIFAKRQIIRYHLKSAHVPHAPIAAGAPKSLRQEIERRLRRTTEIRCEPQLLHKGPDAEPPIYFGDKVYHSFYRMKAIDSVKQLENELQQFDANLVRAPGVSLKQFLKNQLTVALSGISWPTIEHLCAAYEHARHETREFREKEYEDFTKTINEIIQHIRNKINKGENKKKFPLQVGDSIFYCSQNVEPGTELKDNAVRFRSSQTASKSGFIKLENRESYSSQTSEINVTRENKENEQRV